MADYKDSGALWKNEHKTAAPSDKQPHYTGVINVAGVEMRLAAWLEGKPPDKVLSLKVSQKRQRQERQQGPGEAAAEAERSRHSPVDDLNDAAAERAKSDPARQEPLKSLGDHLDNLDDEIPF